MITKICIQMIEASKQTVKEHRSSENPIIRFGVSIFYVIWNTVKTARRVCVDTDFRSILFLQLLNSKNVHQTTSLTYMDRYPTIFSACRDYFDGKKDLKILSYGCSTGEEVLTLRRYFPDAHIIGADINKHSFAICRSFMWMRRSPLYILHLRKSKSMDLTMQFSAWLFCSESHIILQQKASVA